VVQFSSLGPHLDTVVAGDGDRAPLLEPSHAQIIAATARAMIVDRMNGPATHK